MKHNRKSSLSIVIPAFNEAAHLRLSLESIAAQSLRPAEVIVVDNNSTDETRAIAESYPFVRVVKEKKQGIVHARNAGFNAARGALIGRLDADTVLPADWVEKMQQFYDAPGNERTVFTGGCYFYNLWTGQLTGRMYDFVVHHVNRLLVGYYFPWGSNCALPAAVWKAVQKDVCLRNDIHEDLDLGLHLMERGFQMKYDSTLRVGARAKRLITEHRKLWSYVMMWPFTLRLHRITVWPLAGMVALMVWTGSYLIITAEYVMRFIKRRVYEAEFDT